MKNATLTIVTTVLTLSLAVFMVWNFLPLSWLKYLTLPQQIKLGATLMTINNSDKISSLPATLNANFDALNTGTIEVGTTSVPSITTLSGLTSAASLATIGTITTGTWNASTLTVSYGGTGSTTLAIGQVLLGSSTNALGVVDGFGTTGQFLTSNGVDVPPTWQTSAVDQAINYHWTGNHNFVGSSYFSSFNASSTLVLNGVSLSYPATQGASSTALLNDGSGNLTWNNFAWVLIEATTTVNDMKSASSTVSMAGYESLRMEIEVAGFSGATVPVLRFNGDNGANYGSENFRFRTGGYEQTSDGPEFQMILSGNSTTSPAFITVDIDNQPTERKYMQAKISFSDTGAKTLDSVMSSGVWNITSTEITSISFATTGESETNKVSAGTRIRWYGKR